MIARTRARRQPCDGLAGPWFESAHEPPAFNPPRAGNIAEVDRSACKRETGQGVDD